MTDVDAQKLMSIVSTLIDVSLQRFKQNGDWRSRFYVPGLTAYNYSISPYKDLNKQRVSAELISKTLDLLQTGLNIRGEYREHTETFHITVDLKTCSMSSAQALVHAEILKVHDDHRPR